jgi:tRNA (guanosine-2'-O-)-methyltransferase
MRRDAPDTFTLPSIGIAEGSSEGTHHPVGRDADGLPAEPAHVIAALDPLLTVERRQRLAQVVAARARAIVPVLDGLIDPHNVSAVLRSADAFGVQELHVIERAERYQASSRVAQGAERWVDVVTHASAEACVMALRARGYRVYVAAGNPPPALRGGGGLDLGGGAVQPEALAREPRAAIVFGNERDGASESLFELADATYTIPMQGFVQSLNVSVAAAITLFAAMRGRPGDLSEADRERLYARYCMLSVPRAEEIVQEYLRRQRR